MKFLCRIGLHKWRTHEMVRAEDYIAMTFDGEICDRCGKVGDPELALEAYYLMRSNMRTRTVRFSAHPALGLDLPPAAGDEGSKEGK